MNACRNPACDGFCVPCVRARVCVPALSVPVTPPLCPLKKQKPKQAAKQYYKPKVIPPARLGELARRRALGKDKKIPHGTRTAYQYHGCLCPRCVRCNADYVLARKERLARAKGQG